MSLEGLPQQFEQFVDRARAALSQEITAAKNIAAAAIAEKNAAQTALSELRDQHKQTQSQLDAVNNELGKASTLAGLNREIAAAGKKLKALQAETAEAEKTLEALHKQRAEADGRLVALNLEANRMIAIRTEGEAVMAHLRAQLQQVSLGQQP
jgi:predicted  nucleic acid-binding Zn-ribbon protein